MFAVAHGVPIATLGLYGTDQLLGRIQAVFGETIVPGQSEDDSERRRLMSQAERAYTESLQEATYEAYSRGGADYRSYPPPMAKNKRHR